MKIVYHCYWLHKTKRFVFFSFFVPIRVFLSFSPPSAPLFVFFPFFFVPVRVFLPFSPPAPLFVATFLGHARACVSSAGCSPTPPRSCRVFIFFSLSLIVLYLSKKDERHWYVEPPLRASLETHTPWIGECFSWITSDFLPLRPFSHIHLLIKKGSLLKRTTPIRRDLHWFL